MVACMVVADKSYCALLARHLHTWAGMRLVVLVEVCCAVLCRAVVCCGVLCCGVVWCGA
jgi:hypothetical protein